MSRQRQLDKISHDCTTLLATVYPDRPKVPVYGEGDPEAAIMLIGEAPGAQETEQRRPFVGKAGQNLNAFLEAIGMTREALYITNAVKFRPFKVHPRTGSLSNRPPTREEIALCYLSEALEGQELCLSWDMDEQGALSVDSFRKDPENPERTHRVFAAHLEF